MISSSQLQCRNDIVCTRVFGDYCIRGNSHQAYNQKLMPRLFTLPVHDIRKSTHPSSEDGWLLSTPNPDCSQSTAEHRRTSSSLIHQRTYACPIECSRESQLSVMFICLCLCFCVLVPSCITEGSPDQYSRTSAHYGSVGPWNVSYNPIPITGMHIC